MDAVEAFAGVERFDQGEAVGHHALVSLPALARHELEQWIRSASAPEEQIEELVDKGTVGRQRESRQDGTGDLLQQTALEPRSRPLENEGTQSVGPPGRQFQSQDAAEGDAHQGGAFQAAPVEKLIQVVNQIGQIKSAAQGKRVIFPTELVADDAEMLSQQSSQGAKQFKTARQARHKNQGGPLAP